MSNYTRGKALGEGTFGLVFQAMNIKTGDKVAIKRIKKSKDSAEGAVVTAIREIKHMQYLSHPNVLKLYEAYTADDCIHMVLEFCPTDLERVINDKSIFLKGEHIQSYMAMAIAGVAFCHDNFVLHRDLKPSNLLIGLNGSIRVADFGLAKSYPTSGNMTPTVVTIWYRSPELLFGAKHYSAAVDVWAMGCIFAELMLRRPIFQANSDSNIEQLQKIFNVMGTPTLENWKNVELLPQFIEFEKRDPLILKELIVDKCRQSTEAYDLLKKLLMLDPRQRCTMQESKEFNYIKTARKIPKMPHDKLLGLPPIQDDNERDTKRTKRR